MPTLLPRFTIHQPSSLAEASALLVTHGDDGAAYAGGTELLLAMKQGSLSFGHLVDLKTVPGLDSIEAADGALRLGALATHWNLERSPLVQAKLPVLARLEHHVANVRVRATGTLGGNLCFGEPHSDPATMLLCLDAHLHLVGPNGPREVRVEDFLVDSYAVALEPGDVLEAVTVPLPRPTQHAVYQKFQVHEYPTLGLGLVLDLDPEATVIREARVAIGSVSPTPRRGPAAEALLIGTVVEAERRLDDAAEALADAADLLDDLDGSAEYKRHLIHVFLRRAFAEALDGRGG